MLQVFDITPVGSSLKRAKFLQNAMNIQETRELNSVYSLEFDMPEDDAKNAYCKPYWYIKYNDDGEFYRITQRTTTVDTVGMIHYTCEHVISTLADSVMFGVVQIGGTDVTTRDVLTALLAKQNTINWTIGTVDFSFNYEYLWEQESILNALFSVPNCFTSPYMFSYDTSSYPWKINLVAIDTSRKPQFYIRARKNLLQMSETKNSLDIVTRIYPIGYGEGVNQLDIKSVNSGLPYIQADAATIAEYGIKERIIVDRSIESADVLKAWGQTVLNQMSAPQYARTLSIADLHDMTNAEIDKAEIGRIAMLTMDQTKTYITKTVKTLDNPGDMEIEFSTSPTDVVSAIVDIAARQRIESTYSQGATQIYSQSIQGNASATKPIEFYIYIPEEMINVNRVEAKIKISKFRAYSQATSNAAASTQTSSGGGESTQTSSSGGGSTQTSGTGGGGSTTVTSGSSSKTTADDGAPALSQTGDTSTGLNINSASTGGTVAWAGSSETSSSSGSGSHTHWVSGHSHGFSGGSHSHSGTTGTHRHSIGSLTHSHGMDHTHLVTVSYPAHSHSVSIPAHTHSVTIPSHTHTVTIPAHGHSITPGIYEFGSPSSAEVYCGSVKKTDIDTSYSGEITSWLLNSSNEIPRDQWITLKIKPDDLAYIVVSIAVKGFCQSYSGGMY